MTTIKTPQSSFNNKNHTSHGFLTFLLLLTWLALGAGFYAVKLGLIQPDEVNPAVSEQIAAIDTKLAALNSRISSLERKLTEASSVLNPAEPTTGAVEPVAPQVVPTEGVKLA